MTAPRQPNTSELRAKVDEARKEQGWSLRELARRLNVNVSTISRFLSGKRQTVSRDLLVGLNRVLQLDLGGVAAQRELDLDLEEEFLAKARLAIRQHLQAAREELGDGESVSNLSGLVSFRIDEQPSTRVYERIFSLPVRRKYPQKTRNTSAENTSP